MCAPSAPAPPDYVGAAKEQGAANVEAARATAQLNNPNVINPFGTQTVTYQGDIPTVTSKFSPEQQALYEKSVQTKGLLGDLGISGATALQGLVGKNLDFSGLPNAPGSYDQTRQRVIDAMMSRTNTDIGQQRDQANSDLIAAGIHPGTAAYETAMDRINRQQTDARQQAEIAGGNAATQAYGTDADRRKAAIAELLAQRETPLNEITALTSGSQVNNPFTAVQGYQGGAVTAPTPIFQGVQAQGQAAMDAYAQKVASSNALTSGLLGLGSMAVLSDRRLKSDIVWIARTNHGLALYEYTIGDRRERGVMADEVRKVMPSAVVAGEDGFDRVNYALLGLTHYPERVRG